MTSSGSRAPKNLRIEVHPKELELLKLIREQVRFGEITIKTRDGLPFRVVEALKFHDLEPVDNAAT